MEENTNINRGAIIMNTEARFIMKKNSGAAVGLLVSTGNHMSISGVLLKSVSEKTKAQNKGNEVYNKDVIVYEDVWIASKVTLLSGVEIGRGSIIGAGSVVRNSIPPYSVVIGNPAKVVGFRFTPEEIIEHEKVLYSEKERLPFEILEKNYTKYYLTKLKEIRAYLRLSC